MTTLPLELQILLQRAVTIEIVADPAASPEIAVSATQEPIPALCRCCKPSSKQRRGGLRRIVSPPACRWESYSEQTKQQPAYVSSTSLLSAKSPFYDMAMHHSLNMPLHHARGGSTSMQGVDFMPRKPHRSDQMQTIHLLDEALNMIDDQTPIPPLRGV